MSETLNTIKISRVALEQLRDVVGSRYSLAVDNETISIRTADRLEARAISDDRIITDLIALAEGNDMLDETGIDDLTILAGLHARIEELESINADLFVQMEAEAKRADDCQRGIYPRIAIEQAEEITRLKSTNKVLQNRLDTMLNGGKGIE